MFLKNTRRRRLLVSLILSIGIIFILPSLRNTTASASEKTVDTVTQSAISATIAPTEEPNQQVTQKNTKKKRKYLYSKGYIKVRKRTSKKSSQKFLLKAGQRVQVLKECKNWVKIKRCGKTGFVLKKYLTSNKKNALKSSKKSMRSFKLTVYCPCYKCSEGWGRQTQSGRKAKANHTIATDLSVLPMYTDVYIEGMGEYTVEDRGGGVKGRHIDVFSNTHNLNVKEKANVSIIMG